MQTNMPIEQCIERDEKSMLSHHLNKSNHKLGNFLTSSPCTFHPGSSIFFLWNPFYYK